MKGIAICFLLVSLLKCGGESETIICKTTGCDTKATVVDLSGLDGCGLVFQLEDGTRLDPIHRVYVQAPTEDEDPLYHFDLKAGQQVRISWQEALALNSCMAGPLVYITCITKCDEPAE
ncbi:MAG: hypothetical protein RIA63_11085 [Cyclobacteriaceae bacterium]